MTTSDPVGDVSINRKDSTMTTTYDMIPADATMTVREALDLRDAAYSRGRSDEHEGLPVPGTLTTIEPCWCGAQVEEDGDGYRFCTAASHDPMTPPEQP